MWACCDYTSSDDDEHNTSNALLLLFADADTAPVLLSGLSDVDELVVALGCKFASDVFTAAQKDRPLPVPTPLARDPRPRALALGFDVGRVTALSMGGRASFHLLLFLLSPLSHATASTHNTSCCSVSHIPCMAPAAPHFPWECFSFPSV